MDQEFESKRVRSKLENQKYLSNNYNRFLQYKTLYLGKNRGRKFLRRYTNAPDRICQLQYGGLVKKRSYRRDKIISGNASRHNWGSAMASLKPLNTIVQLHRWGFTGALKQVPTRGKSPGQRTPDRGVFQTERRSDQNCTQENAAT